MKFFSLKALVLLLMPIGLFAGSDTTILIPEPTIVVAPGFSITPVVEKLGRNRHIAVAPNGDLFVKLERLRDGKGIIHLKPGPDGQYREYESFGNYTGTGILVRGRYLYASSDDALYRYPIDASGKVQNQNDPQRIVYGLVSRRQHASKSIALDNAGNIYVNIGAPSNACQERDRTKGSAGMDPCPILDSAGGIWRFRTDVSDQSYAQGTRYATGLRNVVGLDWNQKENALYAMMHGRDMLSSLYPEMYSDSISAELPGEEMFLIREGGNYGWPYCYYDPLKNKKVLAPEYGGDGNTAGRCAGVEQPLVSFPGHWGPNAMLFYTGTQFPEKYRNGVFVAFHGSWNRAPFRQAGYNVAFVPMKNGRPSGPYEVFADGFTGKEVIMNTGEAQYRPCGLAMLPDGSLLVSDSKEGRVWVIRYQGK
ncbi:MAG TPA: PQQ-dependent sugar dehydrogenase [Phnomibacter sp.]|nr:PQQ-dependent sugar dehydrogenase [Phnomibacter sp.]